MNDYMRDYMRKLIQDYVSSTAPDLPPIPWGEDPEGEGNLIGMMEAAYEAGWQDYRESLE